MATTEFTWVYPYGDSGPTVDWCETDGPKTTSDGFGDEHVARQVPAEWVAAMHRGQRAERQIEAWYDLAELADHEHQDGWLNDLTHDPTGKRGLCLLRCVVCRQGTVVETAFLTLPIASR